TWDEVTAISKTLTKTNAAGDILQSGLPMGTFENTEHAFEILTTLILQAGDAIVRKSDRGVSITERTTDALIFYTSFAEPGHPNFSWKSASGNSLDAFAQEKAAFAFGFSRDIPTVRQKNPHLNFGILPFPQRSAARSQVVYADYVFPTVYRYSLSPVAAWRFISFMASKDAAKKYVERFGLAPARRDLLAENAPALLLDPFYRQSLIARNWLIPNEATSRKIFSEAVNSILLKTVKPVEATNRLREQMRLILQ
ncbi:MAG: extracellular solute-binding protein, partial [bacterium]|nr:extracellular solute-binding protein [bacterium]